MDGIYPAPGSLDFAQVKLAGQIAHFLTAVLILVFFTQLPKFGAHRKLLPLWTAAWVALVVTTCIPAAAAVERLSGLQVLRPDVGLVADLVLSPARFLFILFVAVAAFEASHKPISRGILRALVVGAVLLGLVIRSVDQSSTANQALVLATPALFLGAALLALTAARGHRSRGMILLALAMVLFATATTLFQLASTDAFSALIGERAAMQIFASESFGMALCDAVLAASVTILVVQDSLHLAVQAREAQWREANAAEERLRQIIEAAGEAIVTFDVDRQIRLANAAAGRVFQVPTPSLIGRRLDQLIEAAPVADPSGAGTRLWWDAGPAEPIVAVGRRFNGTSFPAELTVGPLVDQGRPGGGVAIVRDMTAHHLAIAERERFERRVGESEKMLAIGRVVSGVAHELNNPLAVVLGQSEQLADLTHDVEVRAGIALIIEQAQRARHIVRDLLAFVRPGTDRGEAVTLGELAGRIAAIQSPRAEARDIRIVVDAPEPAVVVHGDRMALEQVVTNLIENAIDASGDGGVVAVRVRRDDRRGLLVVEDTGPGVDPEHIGRIFEPFFTTKGVGQGTGLGLPVSAGLVERQGGSLQLENRPQADIGARFVVGLPLSTEPVVELVGGRGRRTTGIPPRRDAQGVAKSVLIIDDEAAVRTTIAMMFSRWGWPVVQRDSARDAVTLLQSGEEWSDPAVILCDLRMPGMTGQEFHRCLREVAPDLAARVIFVTGDVVEADTALFLQGVDQPVVEKPFTLAEMAGAVQEILDQG
jgi:two-component system NtrC family sensor kinase